MVSPVSRENFRRDDYSYQNNPVVKINDPGTAEYSLASGMGLPGVSLLRFADVK